MLDYRTKLYVITLCVGLCLIISCSDDKESPVRPARIDEFEPDGGTTRPAPATRPVDAPALPKEIGDK